MKTTLSKKSQSHKSTIEEIVGTIQEIGKKKISHIILFGSFARGDFYETEIKEESDGRLLQYISDYDFLVITKNYEAGTGIRAINLAGKIKEKIEKRLLDKERPVSIIIEPLVRVNKDLKKGNYFFADIKKEGILLYQGEKVEELKEPKELTNKEMKELARNYYEEWFEKAESFYDYFKFGLEKSDYKGAAFMLHQATENLYQCAHLVFTNYSPKLHDIEKLNKPLIYYSKEFINIFPQNNEEEKECFDLLKRAYVEARYNKDYSVTKEQLEYLLTRVEKLKKVIKEVCKKKINSF